MFFMFIKKNINSLTLGKIFPSACFSPSSKGQRKKRVENLLTWDCLKKERMSVSVTFPLLNTKHVPRKLNEHNKG